MNRRGMTLAECLVALVVSAVLVAAVESALVAGRRFAAAATATRGVRHNLRAGAAVLRHELEGVAPIAGDLKTINDSALVIRAQRMFGVVCAVIPPGTLVLDDSLLAQLRAPDPARDSVLVLAEGDRMTALDDAWLGAALSGSRRGSCRSGAPGTALILAGVSGPAFSGIVEGAPVRLFESAEYRRYRDAAGAWWLGVRSFTGGAWSASSPIAGPLRGRTGLELRVLDAALMPALAPESVRVVEIALRVIDPRPFRRPGTAATSLEDSALVRAGLAGP